MDREDTNLMLYFDECFNFIDEAKRLGGGVLVHCFMGISRRWYFFHHLHYCLTKDHLLIEMFSCQYSLSSVNDSFLSYFIWVL